MPSPIRTLTVGSGITPDLRRSARGLYRRWGLPPRPEGLSVIDTLSKGPHSCQGTPL